MDGRSVLTNRQATAAAVPTPVPGGAHASESGANAQLLQNFYAAFVRGDAEGAAGYVTSDFIMHVPGRGLNAGDYWGRDGLRRFMRNIQNYVGGVFEMRIAAMSVADTTAFTREIVVLNRKRDPENRWRLRFIMHYEFRNGAVSEAWTIPEDQYLYDSYWDPAAPAPRPAPVESGATAASALADTSGATDPANRALVEEFYRRFWNGDLEGMRKLMTEDAPFFVPGRSKLAGEYRGFSGYLAFRDKLVNLAGDKYKLAIAGIAAGRNDVFVKEYVRMNRKWDPAPREVFVVLHFEMRQGRIARIDDIPVDTYAYEAFFDPADGR